MHGRTHRVLIECSSQSRPTSNSRGTSPYGGSVRAVLRCCLPGLLHPLTQFREVERSRAPEGPVESPPTDGLLQAGRDRVQVRTPAGQRIAKIGDTSPPDQHHTQQIAFVRALPAAHTCALRAGPGTRPARHFFSLPPRTALTPSGVMALLQLAPPGARAPPAGSRPVPAGSRGPGGPVTGHSSSGAPSRSRPASASRPWPPSAVSGRMSMRQPVSRAARRAFCPSLPMASESW